MKIRLPLSIFLIAFITGYSGGIAATPVELLEGWKKNRHTGIPQGNSRQPIYHHPDSWDRW